MSSFGATGLFEYERDPPVFRIVVMGSPETGKTALCNRLVAHSFSDHTQHTRSIDSYFVTLSDLVVGDAAAGGTGAPRRIPTVCELQDVPGEAHEGVLPGTPEYRVTLKAARHCPRPSNAKQWRDSEYTPSAQELLVNARAAELEQEEKAHSFSNVLYNMRPPMGFIVLVSFNPKVATASFGKAKHIINTLKRNRFLTETPTPLLLFANMEDETMLGISGAVPSGHIAKLMNDCVALVSHADMREHARLAFGSVKGGWASFVDTSRRGGKARFVTAGRPDAELPPQGSLREAWAAALPTPLYPSAVRLGKTETGAEFTTPCRTYSVCKSIFFVLFIALTLFETFIL